MARIFHGLHGRAGEAIDVIGHRLWPQRPTYVWKVSSSMQAYVLKYFYRVNFKGIGSLNNSCGTTFYCTNLIELVMSESKVKFSFLFSFPFTLNAFRFPVWGVIHDRVLQNGKKFRNSKSCHFLMLYVKNL